MQYPAQVQAVVDLLNEAEEKGSPADRIMAHYFRSRRYIGSKDKAVISELFYSILREKLSLTYVLQTQNLDANPRNLVAAKLHLDGADLARVFTAKQYQPAKLTIPNIEALGRIEELSLAQAPEYIQLNVPQWLESKLRASLGGRFKEEMLSIGERAKTDIRVNGLKSSRDSLLKALRELEFSCEATPISQWGIRFDQRVALFNTKQFKNGEFEVQDEGSQLIAVASGVEPGMKVVDFCAGAGGKSLALAAMMQNKGVLYACDVHSKRLAETQKRAKRAGVHNLRTKLLSSENDKWVKQHAGFADLVLIDAPCSGTGTWRRSPDSRWNLTAKRLSDLQALQKSILESASRLVKPKGKLLYATCSLLREENEDQVEAFLDENAEFARCNLENDLEISGVSGSELRLSTSEHQTDGFYLSLMVKAKH